MSESKLRLYAHIPSQPQHNTDRGGHYKLKNMINKKIEESAKHYAEENSMSIEDQMGDIYMMVQKNYLMHIKKVLSGLSMSS